MPASAEEYKGFQIAFWDLIIQQVQAIPLKMVHDNKDFITTMEAIRISSREIRDEELMTGQ
ncbi:MAG: hypothetical protein EOO07_09355 [Chitinophagaceae bacterium]|nr:MAG: hypothetical protein EOO07_09355 [Chitinophagaceae bacterium]